MTMTTITHPPPPSRNAARPIAPKNGKRRQTLTPTTSSNATAAPPSSHAPPPRIQSDESSPFALLSCSQWQNWRQAMTNDHSIRMPPAAHDESSAPLLAATRRGYSGRNFSRNSGITTQQQQLHPPDGRFQPRRTQFVHCIPANLETIHLA